MLTVSAAVRGTLNPAALPSLSPIPLPPARIFPSVATILCVDDDPALLTLLKKTLERMGHAASEAPGVPAALTALANQSVDLVVSDFSMPGATGIDLLDLMRQQGY